MHQRTAADPSTGGIGHERPVGHAAYGEVPMGQFGPGEGAVDVDRHVLRDHPRARIEDESRVLGRPQSLELVGDNLDFPVKASGGMMDQ